MLRALLFYTIMAVVGFIYMSADDPAGAQMRLFGDGNDVGWDTLIGAGVGLVVVALSWFGQRFKPLQELSNELGRVIGEPGSIAIAALACSSAIGEEILFRGAIQPGLGLWWTSAIFAFLHGGTRRSLRLSVIFAFLAGLLLGWLTEWTGNLLAPILCHVTVNYFNLHLIVGRLKETKTEVVS